MKQILFTYKDKDYILEFNRAGVSNLERRGFDPEELGKKPMTMWPMLFRGAFMMHHPTAKQEFLDEIYKKLPNKEELIVKLVELYSEPYEALMAEPEEASENVEWVASW